MSSEEPLSTSRPCRYTRGDIALISLYSMRGERLLGTIVVLLLAVYLVAIGSAQFGNASTLDPTTRMMAIGSIVLGLGLVYWIFIRGGTTLPRNNVDRSYTLQPDALVCVQGQNVVRLAWPVILRVVRTRSAILLFVTTFTAHVIPLRAFDDVDAAKAFFDAVQARWGEGRSASTANRSTNTFEGYSVEYVMRREDYLNGFQGVDRINRRGKGLMKTILIWGVYVGALGSGAVSIAVGNMLVGGVLLAFAGVFQMTIGAPLLTSARTRLRIIEKNPRAYAPGTVALSPEALLVSNGLSTSEFGWNFIAGIEADEKMLYFALGSGNCLFIPRWAFPTPQHADEFVAAAQAYKRGESPSPPAVDAGIWPPPPTVA